MVLKKQTRRRCATRFIFRVSTDEGTYDLLKSGDRLHPGKYWMREDQICAFGDPKITEAIEQKRWKLIPLQDGGPDDFVMVP